MIYAVMLCAFAAFSTGVGGIIVAFFRELKSSTMSVFQGFAAGVMVAVSAVEMMPRCFGELAAVAGAERALLGSAVLFAAGWASGGGISAVADYIYKDKCESGTAKRISLVTTAVMVLHNLPEGMLTIFSGAADAEFGLKMAIAVALHNIPEGVVVASGVMFVTASRRQALWHSFMAGASEFAGGIMAAVLLGGMADTVFTAAVLGVVSGIMVQTSLCELAPAGVKLSGYRHTFCGIAAGAAVIYLSLCMM